MRNPPVSYAGALELYGRYDHKALKRLSTIVGGLLLVSPVAPVAWIAAMWGWIDQKSEALSIVAEMIDSVKDKLRKLAGYERQELITASHTIIVITSFFDVLRGHIGEEHFRALDISDYEKAFLAGTAPDISHAGLIDYLYRSPIPIPSATAGFSKTAVEIEAYMQILATNTCKFLSGLAVTSDSVSRYFNNRRLRDALVQDSVQRYKSLYVKLAADIPEFFVWAMLNEHSALGASLDDMQTSVTELMRSQKSALASLEDLLRLSIGPETPDGSSATKAIRLANQGLLAQPIIAAGTLAETESIIFPTVEQIYVNPRYKVIQFDGHSSLAHDRTWENCDTRDDLDALLAAFLTSYEATLKPLVILGHPGAGKSLLTKVFAARLPGRGFAAMRVPLRRVDATAPIYLQIQQALETATHGRAEWRDLSAETAPALKVVFLDGLDELLQATAVGRPEYVYDVCEFQRVEAGQNSPVAAIITSRTTVADGVRLPIGTTVIKLQDFNDQQIDRWLHAWSSVNRRQIDQGLVGTPSEVVAHHHRELARQPLLLLMLALYSADTAAEQLDSELSTSQLYGRLLENFVRREIAKTDAATRKSVESAMGEQLWRLGVAAFAMFNRGRQDIADIRLADDLIALREPWALAHDAAGVITREHIGQQTIGHFFFVHTAEADGAAERYTRHSYEFLHATFGEYLVAYFAVTYLRQLPRTTAGSNFGGFRVDDSMLFALLSHQPLSLRSNVTEFVAEMCSEIEPAEADAIRECLEHLWRGYKSRPGAAREYDSYKPLGGDSIRELSAYSANLLILRLCIDPEVQIADLMGSVDDALSAWKAQVSLWVAGLDDFGWRSLCNELGVTDGTVYRELNGDALVIRTEYYRLTGDTTGEVAMRLGLAAGGFAASWTSSIDGPSLFSAILMDIAGNGVVMDQDFPLIPLSAGFPEPTKTAFANFLAKYLSVAIQRLPSDRVIEIVDLLLHLIEPGTAWPDLAVAVGAYPELAVRFPRLADAELYLDQVKPAFHVPFVFAAAASRPTISADEARILSALKHATADALHISNEALLEEANAQRWFRYLIGIDAPWGDLAASRQSRLALDEVPSQRGDADATAQMP